MKRVRDVDTSASASGSAGAAAASSTPSQVVDTRVAKLNKVCALQGAGESPQSLYANFTCSGVEPFALSHAGASAVVRGWRQPLALSHGCASAVVRGWRPPLALSHGCASAVVRGWRQPLALSHGCASAVVRGWRWSACCALLILSCAGSCMALTQPRLRLSVPRMRARVCVQMMSR
jgi:hypothetical protein